MPYAAVPSPMVCLECSSEAAAKFRRWIEFPTHNVAHVFPVPPETRSALRKLHLQARLGLVIPTSVLHQSFPKPVPIWFERPHPWEFLLLAASPNPRPIPPEDIISSSAACCRSHRRGADSRQSDSYRSFPMFRNIAAPLQPNAHPVSEIPCRR